MLRFRKRVVDHHAILAGLFAVLLVVIAGCEKSEVEPQSTTTAQPAASREKINTNDQTKPASVVTLPPAPNDAATSGPMISFNKKQHDFGSLWDIEEVTYRFEFTNTGDETLIIDQNLKTSCGCTAAEPDKYAYEPGERGTMGITFKPKGHGRQAKTITVVSNAVNEPSITLVIRSDISQFVKVEPHILRFEDVEKGQRHTKIVKLTSVDPNFQVIGVQPRQGNLTARLLNLDTGPRPANSTEMAAPKLIEITLDEHAKWGQVFGAVNVKTRGSLPGSTETLDHDVTITVNATVYNTVIPEMAMIQCGVIKPGASFSKSVRLTSRNGKPFNITSVELIGSTVPGMKAEVQPLNETDAVGYDVTVSANSGTFVGGIRGTLQVTTDVPGDELINFRVAGVIKE